MKIQFLVLTAIAFTSYTSDSVWSCNIRVRNNLVDAAIFETIETQLFGNIQPQQAGLIAQMGGLNLGN